MKRPLSVLNVPTLFQNMMTLLETIIQFGRKMTVAV